MLSSCTSGGRSQATDKSRSSKASSHLKRHLSQADLLASSISDNLDCTSGNSSSERSYRSLLSRNHRQQSAINQSIKVRKDQEQLNRTAAAAAAAAAAATTTTTAKLIAHVDQNNNNIYQLNHQQQVQLSNENERYVNADGSIFTLANSSHQALILQQQSSRGESNIVHGHALARRQFRSPPLPPLPRSKGTRDDQVSAPESSRQSEHQHQHQHQLRRLQYEPIHQQLQRIYGNKLQEFEQKQIQLNRQHQHQQRQSTSKHSASLRKRRQQDSIRQEQLIEQQSSAMIKTLQSKQARSATQQPHDHNGHSYGHQLHQHYNLQHTNQQFQQHQQILYHEQTYDSLSPQPAPSPPPQLPPVNNNDNSNGSGQKFRKQTHRVMRQNGHICAIPEEECDMSNGEILMQARATESNDEEEVLMSDEEDELEEQLDDELLTSPSGHFVTQSALNNASGKSGMDSVDNTQKKHLESLHYATATAAALLNVTASAAAAFVASEKRLNQRNRDRQQAKQQQQQQHQQRQHQQHQQSMAPQIYSNTYQDIGSKHQQQQQAHCHPSAAQYKQTRTTSYGQQRQVQSQMQLLQPNQYYLPASDLSVSQVVASDQRHARLAAHQQQHRQPALGVISQQANLVRGANGQQEQLSRSMSFRVHEQLHQQLQQQQQQLQQQQLQQQQQQQRRLMQQAVYGQYQSQFCQPTPPAPAPSLASQKQLAGQYLEPARMHPNPAAQLMAIKNAPLTAQQIDLLRRHKQLQQLTQVQGAQQLRRVQSTNVANNKRQQLILPMTQPALAILGASQNKLNAPTGLDTNLVARLTGANQQQLIQMACGFDPRQIIAAQSMFNASKAGNVELAKLHGLPAVNLSNNSNKPQGQLTTYGLIVSNQDKHKQPQLQQIYAIGAPAQLAAPPPLPAKHHAQGAASGASSNASHQSNLPLILDKRLRSVSFVDKICQIDLTLLWWSLLTICVIFVATIVTISRYIF